jgi:hypothetical protein
MNWIAHVQMVVAIPLVGECCIMSYGLILHHAKVLQKYAKNMKDVA